MKRTAFNDEQREAWHTYQRLRNAWTVPRNSVRDVIEASPHHGAKFWLEWFDREFKYRTENAGE